MTSVAHNRVVSARRSLVRGNRANRPLWKRLEFAFEIYQRERRRCLHDLSEDSVHEARIAARRLLSMVRAVKPWVRTQEYTDVDRQLRLYLKATNALREAQTRLFALENDESRAGLPALVQRARIECEGLASELNTRLHHADLRAGAVILAERFEHLTADENLRSIPRSVLVEELTDRYYRLVRRCVRDARHGRLSHQRRVKVKMLRYALEAFMDDTPFRAEALDRLRRLQHGMGNSLDASALIHWLLKKVGRRETKHFFASAWRRRRDLRKSSLAFAQRLG